MRIAQRGQAFAKSARGAVERIDGNLRSPTAQR